MVEKLSLQKFITIETGDAQLELPTSEQIEQINRKLEESGNDIKSDEGGPHE